MSRLIDADDIVYESIDSSDTNQHEYYYGTGIMAVRKEDIDAMPTIKPEQRWIPCSETVDLPEVGVLCCDRYKNELIGWLSCEDDQWLCESDGEIMYDPIAWQPRPEPYKEDDDGDK